MFLRIVKSWITWLFVGGVVFAASVTTNTVSIPPPPLDHNGVIMNFDYTDSNIEEDILIYLTQSEYGGWGKVYIPMAIVNTTNTTQNVELRGLFGDDSEITSFAEHVSDVEYFREVPVYGPKDVTCGVDWTATTTELGSAYQCGKLIESCDTVTGTNCHYNNTYTATTSQSYLVDEWQPLGVSIPDPAFTSKRTQAIPAGYAVRGAKKVLIPSNSIRYFLAELSFTPTPFSERKEFLVEGIPETGKSGLLR